MRVIHSGEGVSFGYHSVDHRGVRYALVVIKCTYVWKLFSGGSEEVRNVELAAAQKPIALTDEMDSEHSDYVRTESDLVPEKPALDVLMAGTLVLARPTDTSACELQIGARLKKQAWVYGPRRLERKWSGTTWGKPSVFHQVPIAWTHAWGGSEGVSHTQTNQTASDHVERNPVGAGKYNDQAPQFVHPSVPEQPHCFAAVNRLWSPRCDYAGIWSIPSQNAGEKKHASENTLSSTSKDFNSRFYNCAPEDQQLEGGYIPFETVMLKGFSSEGHVCFRLPSLQTRIVCIDTHAQSHGYVVAPDTLTIYPDENTFTLTSRVSCYQPIVEAHVAPTRSRKYA